MSDYLATALVAGLPLAFMAGHWLGKRERGGRDYDRGFRDGGQLALYLLGRIRHNPEEVAAALESCMRGEQWQRP